MIPNQSKTQELLSYIIFLKSYFATRILTFGHNFERIKDVIVAILIVKRGKYSQSFLNTSFLLLVVAVIVGGPVIAENNPFIAGYLSSTEPTYQSILAADVESLPIDTTISQKPRDRVVEYEVKGGDTLATIAKKFDVTSDSIKWATNLKTDTIKPGQKLKVPPVSGVIHKVASGDNIYAIAKKYGTDAQKIANFPFNDFADLETFELTSGQMLYVPDGVPPQEKPVSPIRRTGPYIAAGQPGTGNFIWPSSGSISQYPVWYHMAVDIANRGLPPVLAADTGTVSYASCLKGGYGCHVRINHANGYESLYAHLSQINVAVGNGVAKGQTIGRVGSTGRSTGPHLHFEVRQSGKLVNPLSFLK